MAKNIIKLNRGDSYEFKVSVPVLDEKGNITNYILTDSDVVYFALLYPHQKFEDAILIKGYDHTDHIIDKGKNTGEILIKIEPKDTRRLAPGIYYYTVKLQRGGSLINTKDCDEPDEVRTIIERTKFIIND
jgi:hypothetical protein